MANGEYSNTAEWVECEQVVIACDDEVGVTCDRALEYPVIVRVSANIEGEVGRDHQAIRNDGVEFGGDRARGPAKPVAQDSAEFCE